MNTQTVVNAVNNLNASRQREVERKAETLILQIRDEQQNIVNFKESIKQSQEGLNKLVDFTQENILGTTLPANNANASVIAEVIAKRQKEQVEGPATTLARCISERQSAIKACEERITKYRQELNGLVAQSVSVEEVAGQ